MRRRVAAGEAAAKTLLADAERQSAGRVTSPPDLLLLMSAPVGEEFVLGGVQKILGDVTVFGGSQCTNQIWRVMYAIDATPARRRGGVVL